MTVSPPVYLHPTQRLQAPLHSSVSTPAHTKHLGWHVVFEGRVTHPVRDQREPVLVRRPAPPQLWSQLWSQLQSGFSTGILHRDCSCKPPPPLSTAGRRWTAGRHSAAPPPGWECVLATERHCLSLRFRRHSANDLFLLVVLLMPALKHCLPSLKHRLCPWGCSDRTGRSTGPSRPAFRFLGRRQTPLRRRSSMMRRH